MEITDFSWISSDRATYLIAVTLLIGFVLWLITRLGLRAFRNLPPGPKGLPLIGDVVHIKDQDWLTSPQRLAEYGNTPYLQCLQRNMLMCLSGEMMYINALGNGVLVINSQRVAVDLLEKRSNIYSDRPHYISAGEFLTQNLTLSFSLYGDLYVVYVLYCIHPDPRILDGTDFAVSLWRASPNQPHRASTLSRDAKRSCWRLN
jgi:hypothetical protein